MSNTFYIKHAYAYPNMGTPVSPHVYVTRKRVFFAFSPFKTYLQQQYCTSINFVSARNDCVIIYAFWSVRVWVVGGGRESLDSTDALTLSPTRANLLSHLMNSNSAIAVSKTAHRAIFKGGLRSPLISFSNLTLV